MVETGVLLRKGGVDLKRLPEITNLEMAMDHIDRSLTRETRILAFLEIWKDPYEFLDWSGGQYDKYVRAADYDLNYLHVPAKDGEFAAVRFLRNVMDLVKKKDKDSYDWLYAPPKNPYPADFEYLSDDEYEWESNAAARKKEELAAKKAAANEAAARKKEEAAAKRAAAKEAVARKKEEAAAKKKGKAPQQASEVNSKTTSITDSKDGKKPAGFTGYEPLPEPEWPVSTDWDTPADPKPVSKVDKTARDANPQGSEHGGHGCENSSGGHWSMGIGSPEQATKWKTTTEPGSATTTKQQMPTSATSPEPFDGKCTCCDTLLKGLEVIHGTCEHRYCLDCTRKMIEDSFKDISLFPPRCCREPLILEKKGDLFDPAIMARYEILLIKHNDPKPLFCHVVSCGAYIPQAAHGNCPVCSVGTCKRCLRLKHLRGCLPPDTTTDDQKLNALADKMKWRACPECAHMIELTTGCKHMT